MKKIKYLIIVLVVFLSIFILNVNVNADTNNNFEYSIAKGLTQAQIENLFTTLEFTTEDIEGTDNYNGTDLTNTTWIFNPTIQYINNYPIYYVNFKLYYNNGNSYGNGNALYMSKNTNYGEFYAFQGNGLTNFNGTFWGFGESVIYEGVSSKTMTPTKTIDYIEFIDGSDITNSNLITWLTNNATRQPSQQTIPSDLTFITDQNNVTNIRIVSKKLSINWSYFEEYGNRKENENELYISFVRYGNYEPTTNNTQDGIYLIISDQDITSNHLDEQYSVSYSSSNWNDIFDKAINCWHYVSEDNILWQYGNPLTSVLFNDFWNYTSFYSIEETNNFRTIINRFYSWNDINNSSYEIGIQEGINQAIEEILSNPNEYDLYSYSDYISYGQQKYLEGSTSANNGNEIENLIYSVLDAPIRIFFGSDTQMLVNGQLQPVHLNGIFNLRILGFDLTGFISALFTITLIIAIIRRIVK